MGLTVLANPSTARAWAGIPLTGLTWSVGVWYARREELSDLAVDSTTALLLISLGGIAQTIAVSTAVAAVLWAMVRAWGARIDFARLLGSLSAACLPLWVAAPALAIWLYGQPTARWPALLLTVVGVCGCLHRLGGALVALTHWSWSRAGSVLLASAVFVASVATLTQS